MATLDEWDPMKEDYEDKVFNSYDRGPGKNLPSNSDSKQVATLFVRKVPPELNESGIRNLFGQFGTVSQVKIITNPNYVTNIAFVTMGSVAECSEAIHHLNNYSIGGSKIYVEFSKPRKNSNKENHDKLPNNKPNNRPANTHTLQQQHVSFVGDRLASVSNSSNGIGCAASNEQSYSDQLASNRLGENGINGGYVSDTDSLQQQQLPSKAAELKTCTNCGKPSSTFKCGNCKVPYCSVECQRNNWSTHKALCNRAVSSRSSGATSVSRDQVADRQVNSSVSNSTASAVSVPVDVSPVSSQLSRPADANLRVNGQMSTSQVQNVQNKAALPSTPLALPVCGSYKVMLTDIQSPVKFCVQVIDGVDRNFVTSASHQTIECSLFGILPIRGNWTDSALQQCKNFGFVVGKSCRLRCLCNTSGNYVMITLEDGSDLGDRLVDGKVAQFDRNAKYKVTDSLHHRLTSGELIMLNVDHSSIEGVDGFYAQAGNNKIRGLIERFPDLESNMSLYGKNAKILPRNDGFVVGDHTLCCYEGAWSRAEVLIVQGNKAAVGFLDYGNPLAVDLDELMPLPRQYSHFPAIAARININGITDVEDQDVKSQAIDRLKSLLLSTKSVSAIVKDVNESTLSVDILTDTGANIGETLLNEGLAVKTSNIIENSFLKLGTTAPTKSTPQAVTDSVTVTPIPVSPQTSSRPSAAASPQTSSRPSAAASPAPEPVTVKPLLNIGQTYTVRLRKLDETIKFSINYPQSINQCIDELTKQLQSAYSCHTVPLYNSPSCGTFVVFQHANDIWRRGVISRTSTVKQMALINHLDYAGESSKVGYQHIHVMLPEFAKTPFQALPICQLEGVESVEIKNNILKPYMPENLELQVLDYKEYTYIVKLYHNGQELKEPPAPEPAGDMPPLTADTSVTESCDLSPISATSDDDRINRLQRMIEALQFEVDTLKAEKKAKLEQRKQ